MRKRIAALIDNPLILYALILMLYIMWTISNGNFEKQPLLDCYHRARNSYEHKRCNEIYGKQE